MKQQIRTDRYGDPLPAGALVRLGTMRFRHEGSANSLAFSPDDKVLASTSAGRVIFWDASTGRQLRRLQVSREHGLFWLRSLDFSPDGRTLAANGGDGSIYLWDTATGKQIRTVGALSGAPDSGKATRFSLDGKMLAVTDSDKVILFDTKTGKEAFRLGGHRAEINSVAFSPNGKTLAFGTLGPAVQIWDLEKGKLLRGIESHGKRFVNSVAFSRDGEVLASGSWDKIVLTEADTGKELATLEAKKMESVSALAFTPDGKTLISASQDGQVRFWDVPGRKERLRLDARMAPIEAMALSRDGKTVAVGSYFNVIRLWDVATGKERFQDFHGHNGIIASVAYAPDGKTLAVAGDSGEVILWDAATGQPRRELKVYRPRGVAFSPDGRRLATVPFSRSFQVWDVATGKELFRLQGKNVVQCVAFSPDGQYLLSAHIGSLILWDPSTGKRLREFSLQTTAHPQSLAFAPDSRTVALGTSDGDLRLWDLEAGQEVLVLTGHRHEVESVAFSPDGKILASGSLDLTVRLWEVASGKEILTLRGHRRAVTSVVFSPDGKVVASGSGASREPIWTKEPNKVRLWDVATGEELAPFQGHGTDVLCLAFSPDGSRLASGLRNSTVLLWDTTQAVHALRRVAQLGPKELEALWSDLAGEDTRKAHAAIWTLTAISNQAASFLKGHLHPAVSKWDPEQIRRWIADLDSDQFAVRQEAMKKLEQVSEDARPALRRALDSKPSLETRKRLEELLSKPKVLRSGEELRGVRAVEVLEHIGTPGAREVLESLVKGAPAARQTREAKTSLERLDKRKATP